MNQKNSTVDFDQLWESTLDKFEDHNKTIAEFLTPSVYKFINDYVLLNNPVFSRSINCITDEYALVVGMPEAKNILYISYDTVGKVTRNFYQGCAFSDDENCVWLYDEFHVTDDHFEHHIIFSDGMEMIVPFFSFHLRKTGWFED